MVSLPTPFMYIALDHIPDNIWWVTLYHIPMYMGVCGNRGWLPSITYPCTWVYVVIGDGYPLSHTHIPFITYPCTYVYNYYGNRGRLPSITYPSLPLVSCNTQFLEQVLSRARRSANLPSGRGGHSTLLTCIKDLLKMADLNKTVAGMAKVAATFLQCQLLISKVQLQVLYLHF